MQNDTELKFELVLGADELLLSTGEAMFVSLVESGTDFDLIYSPGSVNSLPAYSSTYKLTNEE